MREAGFSGLDVPYGADQTLFIVIDRIENARDIRIERNDLESVIHELLAGCFNDPVRVVAFNTLEHWVKDLSVDVSSEIQSRCDMEGVAVPDHLEDFVATHLCASPSPRLRPDALRMSAH